MDQDRLIRIAARLLIEKHGERAQGIAAQRAQEWIERQDGAAALLWISIRDAVGELEAAGFNRASLSLSDLLGGKTVRQMMAADSVADDDLTSLIEDVKRQRRA